MTEIVDDFIQQSLKAVNSKAVCEVCIEEKNNECDKCYLSERS